MQSSQRASGLTFNQDSPLDLSKMTGLCPGGVSNKLLFDDSVTRTEKPSFGTSDQNCSGNKPSRQEHSLDASHSSQDNETSRAVGDQPGQNGVDISDRVSVGIMCAASDISSTVPCLNDSLMYFKVSQRCLPLTSDSSVKYFLWKNCLNFKKFFLAMHQGLNHVNNRVNIQRNMQPEAFWGQHYQVFSDRDSGRRPSLKKSREQAEAISGNSLEFSHFATFCDLVIRLWLTFSKIFLLLSIVLLEI